MRIHIKMRIHIRQRINTAGIIAAALSLSILALLSIGCATGSPDLPPPESKGSDRADAPEAGGGEMPEWFLDPQEVYPDNKYMTAIGSGDTRRGAEQSALGALSQRFSAEVTMDLQTQERYKELVTSDDEGYTEQETALNQGINVRSDQTLLNVQFGKAAVDEQGRVHVIAFLERAPTGRLYQKLISKNGGKIVSYLQEAEESDSIVRRYAYLSAAATVASGNEVLIEQLRIIAPGYEKELDLPYDNNELNKRRTDTASQMKVSISIAGDEGSRITDVVRKSLSKERFPLGEPGTLKVEGSASLEEIEGGESFEAVRWVLSLDLYGPEGSSLVSYNNQDRASGVSKSAARSFAYDDMQKDVEQEFVGALKDYFNEMVMGE
ncbi:MAG: LPP20 family lipoprotein [Spirochaetia bacterium]